MVGPARLSVRLDDSALDAAFAALTAFAETGERPLELAERLVRAIEAGAQVFRFKIDGSPACPADELVVALEPTDGLAVLLAATGAGNVDLGVVEEALRHIESSIGQAAPAGIASEAAS